MGERAAVSPSPSIKGGELKSRKLASSSPLNRPLLFSLSPLWESVGERVHYAGSNPANFSKSFFTPTELK